MIHPTMDCANGIEQDRSLQASSEWSPRNMTKWKKQCTKLFLSNAIFVKKRNTEDDYMHTKTHTHLVFSFFSKKKQLHFEIRISKTFMQMGRVRSRCVCTYRVYGSKFPLNTFGLIVLTLYANVSSKKKKERETTNSWPQTTLW